MTQDKSEKRRQQIEKVVGAAAKGVHSADKALQRQEAKRASTGKAPSTAVTTARNLLKRVKRG